MQFHQMTEIAKKVALARPLRQQRIQQEQAGLFPLAFQPPNHFIGDNAAVRPTAQ